MAKRRSTAKKEEMTLEDAVREAKKAPLAHITPEYIDTKESEVNLGSIEAAISERQRLRKESMLVQPFANISIDSPFSALVVLFGDVHYGSGDTDHDLFMRDYNAVLETPNVYAFFMSNMIDNAIPSQYPDGMLQNVIPPEEQIVAMRSLTRKLDEAGKMLGAIVSPCHEGWTYKRTGQDVNRLLYGYEGRKFPVLDNGGAITVSLGGSIEYVFALYHQVGGGFNSNLNKNNSTQRMRQLQRNNADVVAAAHNHVSEAMQNFADRREDRRPICYLRTGCYKLDDHWAKGKGYVGGEPGGQSVMLYAAEKRMVPFLEIETALEHHKALMLVDRALRSR